MTSITEAASASTQALSSRAVEGFRQHFGSRPYWLSVAPGRVNLIGEHVDYNNGKVLPMAVDLHVVMTAAPGNHTGLRVYSAAMGHEILLSSASRQTQTGSWAAYIEGVYQLFGALGLDIPGLDVYIESNLPSGAGLSSSAALEVATASLLEVVVGEPLESWQKIRLCQKAEHEWAGVPCGIMDQAAVVLAQAGHLLQLDCRSLESQQILFDEPDICVLITNSQVQHKLSDSPYAQRRAQCESAGELLGASLRDVAMQDINDSPLLDPETKQRARHVVSEIARVEDMTLKVSRQDWETAGACLYASHLSLKEQYEVSCPELDLLVELAQDIGQAGGMFGSRMTGAGFGGCTVSLIASSEQDAIIGRLREGYRAKTGLDPDFVLSRPAAGAACFVLHGPQT